eukprot:91079_1
MERPDINTLSRGSLSRTHSHLLHGPELLRLTCTQVNTYSPRGQLEQEPKALLKMQSMPRNTSIVSQDRHITPDWYHLALVKMQSKANTLASTVASPLSHQSSVLETEIEDVCCMIQKACKLRQKYVYQNIKQNGHIGSILKDKDLSLEIDRMQHILPISEETTYSYAFVDGVAKVYKETDCENDTKQSHEEDNEIFETHSFDDYLEDLGFIYKLMAFGPAKSLCYKRLKILQCRFKLHLLLNHEVEATESHSVPYRDFYNVRKIDNHIHHSACMHQKHLLRFMKDKYNKEPNKIVNHDNKTLKQVFDDLGINVDYLSVDKLDVHAQQATFQRFDKFNAKYNPLGQQPLRKIFLKYDNAISGEFLAEISKEVFKDLERQKYQFCEYRITVHGKKKEEWDTLSDWVCNYQLHSPQVRWLIQVPRIYPRFKESGLVNNFHEMLSNIFEPLFEVTINPSSHPSLHLFLQMVVGFDSVDDESIPESMMNSKHVTPKNYNSDTNPPYIYYMYYMWVNIHKLNKLREERGFNTFALRPHAGEAGSLNHLASTFLLSHSINHGIRLRYSPTLQYLYYLEQIGLSVAPLSNNILFEEYHKNPFPLFFERGLNVTLSSDDPLLIHYTKDALLEEYSIAAQVYNLSAIDLCEIARNSVLQCGWDEDTKKEWIGTDYQTKKGAAANDICRTNVPNSRIQFRHLMLKEEQTFIESHGKDVLSQSSFFTEKRDTFPIDEVDDEFRFSLDSDEEEAEPITRRKKRQKLKPIANGMPVLRPMQSRKSFDTDEGKTDDEEEVDKEVKSVHDTHEAMKEKTVKNKDRMYSISNNIHGAIDGLLQMIDSLNDNGELEDAANISNIKQLDLKDKYNNDRVTSEKRLVRTPLGDGCIVSETAHHCVVDTKTMRISIDKSKCKSLDGHQGAVVETEIGNGVIVDSNDTCYVIQMDNMIASLFKAKCKVMHSDHHHHYRHKEENMMRDIREEDLEVLCALEVASYPADEAASRENLFYRFIFAAPYFKVFTCNEKVIGFVCGTKTKEKKLTDECMSVHDKDGAHLCIHSVVIAEEYRRRGLGRKMMKLYVKEVIGSAYNLSLLSIRLVCKKHLISFYRNCGFGLIGESDLEHGKDKWYEMAIDITHE